ncbi:MAG TPA: DUF2461 family protein [Candidatus Acidoferrales bacterium]|nr:DUF2461 family protein [Candidatus Acidoferrales bacterium]
MAKEGIITAETLRFFRELGRNNGKEWMDENRERYRAHVVEPLRRLFEALAPGMRKLHKDFALGGRSGENFSRINRDIRFANDKTPYYTHMYLFFSHRGARGEKKIARGGTGGQLYVGISADAATVGFRIYATSGESALRRLGAPRAAENLDWLARQRAKLGPRYDGYWYSVDKGEWTKHAGWPQDAKEWKKAKGWIVRRRLAGKAATRGGFAGEAEKILREIFPLYSFCCLEDWRRNKR